MRSPSSRAAVGALVLLGLALPSAPARAATRTRDVRKEAAAPPATRLTLTNLAGRVRVEPHRGPGILVEARLTARAGSEEEAGRLLSLLDVSVERADGTVEVTARYPVETHTVYRYTEGMAGARLVSRWTGVEWDHPYQGRRVTVTTRRDGTELFADFVLRVPAGVAVEVRNAFGHVVVRDLAGELSVEARVADVEVRGGKGGARVRTELGDVVATGRKGAVRVATRMGDVRLEALAGEVSVETLSGEVNARGLSADGALDVSTGSGDVELVADVSRATRVRIETGSGDVEATLERLPAVRISAVSRGGEAKVSLPGLSTKGEESDSVEAEFLEPEPGRERVPVEVRSRSGNVRVRGR
ncbi:MAG: hypothetical protein EDX89_19480 [Acidobacteria bacterium]|nr:MAG: hypothetical protein EDX89_19480 [Acidobacteriota bacterium]